MSLPADELEECPVLVDALTLLRRSAWAESMFNRIEEQWLKEGRPSEVTVLGTLEGVPQVRLSEIVESFYTGKLETDTNKVEDHLRYGLAPRHSCK